ncbi:MFS transporter [Endozoicomonas sp. OPT23]|uniref:MFS transporter n=1 Tax=Endozoicomonas sp. OPT23 TaxID=2072845 RepID=UPI0018918CE5|nr:MFS transporter [Endozoicomonas sp. OPT23]
MNKEYSLSRKQLAGLLLGNIIEYYDYILYGLMTPVIATLFFPSDDRLTSLLNSFVLFASGMLIRPVSGVILGYLGDCYGRRRVLLLSCFATGLGTFGIGCLPDAASAGVMATVLLVLLRLLQGFGMAGEFCSVLVCLGEMAPPSRRGFITSLAHSSGMLGTLLSSLVVALIYLLPDEQLYSWGWRLPFWFGGIVCFTAWGARKKLPRLPDNNAEPINTRLYTSEYVGLLRMLMVVGVNTLIFHLFFVFFSTQMIEILAIPKQTAMLINSINLVGLVAFSALGGWLGDRFGRRKVYSLCLTCITLISVPAYSLLNEGYGWVACAIVQGVFAMLGGCTLGVSSALYTELLPARIRMSGTMVPYNIAIVVFGGTAPLIAIGLMEWTGTVSAPGYYLSLVCLLAFLLQRRIRDKTGLILE